MSFPHPHRYWFTDYSLTALLLFLCLHLFVVQPLGRIDVGGRLFVTLIFSLILVSGVGVVATNAVTKVVVGAVVFAALLVHVLWLVLGNRSLVVWDVSLSALFCLVLALVVLAQVFSEGPITAHRIQGAVAVYLLIGLAFAFAYQLIELQWADAFAPPAPAVPYPEADIASRFVYFSLVTLTTVGYGDITAVHPFARSLATAEALVGQLFPSILLARLVSLQLFHRQTASVGKQ